MKTILLGLNELNFHFVDFYIRNGKLKNFEKIFNSSRYSETSSENDYNLLEPWIQWVTINTGLMYDEHKVFRLGDIKGRTDLKQIYEEVEASGHSVGAISPFNTENRLKNPKFFVSDPWTQTKNSGPSMLTDLGHAISQAVNDNADGKISMRSALVLFYSLVRYSGRSDYVKYLRRMFQIRKKGMKAIILDKLLGDTFVYYWKKTTPDFSHLFLNSAAHIQHHYMFNSAAYDGPFHNPTWYCPQDQDPLFEILKEYDLIIGKLLKLNVRIVIATGLHQIPHSQMTYYWRLRSHKSFLNEIKLEGMKDIQPRMSRDFLIEFNSADEAKKAQQKLESFYADIDSKPIFNIDNRGSSLFIELIYPAEIGKNFSISSNEIKVSNFEKHVAFVAIKNGMHHHIGYVLDTENKLPKIQFPLPELYHHLKNNFKSL